MKLLRISRILGLSSKARPVRCFLLSTMLTSAVPSSAQVVPSAREAAGTAAEQAGQLRQAFDDYVAALQALPDPPPAEDDTRLRKRIITLALKLDPPPVVPDEAVKQIVGTQTTAKSAENLRDFEAAISQYQKALRLAPWVASGYLGLGELQEKLRDYPPAIQNFELYLLAAPTALDSPSIQKRITDLHSRFPAGYLQTHSIFTQSDLRPAWALNYCGELTVSGASVEFRDECEPKHSFAFPISDLRSLERRKGPSVFPGVRMPFPVLRIKLRNGKKFDLAPQPPSEEALTAMEKALKDMAAQNGVALN
jgi:tetratricopeptide (TPR) repeat protein